MCRRGFSKPKGFSFFGIKFYLFEDQGVEMQPIKKKKIYKHEPTEDNPDNSENCFVTFL